MSSDEYQEEWRPIVGFEGMYEVSSDGGVRRIKNDAVALLKRDIIRGGYARVRLSKYGRQHRRLIHRAVLAAFVGPCPEGMQGCHGNGVRTDNRLSNLRWDTPRANHADRIAHGTNPAGERNGRAKLTEEDVREIRRLASEGRSERSLISQFGVSRYAIQSVKSRRLWAHVA